MKAQCERCKEIVELAFALDEGGIRVRCGACGASYHVAAAEVPAPAATPPLAAPAGPPPARICPKCGEGSDDAEAAACRRCGLVFAKWKGKVDDPGAAPELAEPRRLWAQIELAWHDEGRHEAFLVQCQRDAAFAFAAQRYRTAQAERGAGAEPIAARSLERVRKMAEAAMFVSARSAPADDEKTPYKGVVLLLVVLLAAVIIALLWVVFGPQRHRPAADDGRVVPVTPVAPVAPATVSPRGPAPAPAPAPTPTPTPSPPTPR